LSQTGTTSGATLLATVVRTFDLAPGESYTGTALVTIPDRVDGDYTIVARTDHYNQVYESGREDNNQISSSAIITLVHPDLAPSDVTTPGVIVSGQPADIEWTVTNNGSGAALGSWTDKVWLSRDGALDGGDILLGTFVHDGPLGAGAGYTGSATVDIPLDATGDYQIIVQTDADGDLRELDGEGDNTAAGALEVSLAPYADLTVISVIAPALTVGDPAQVEVTWTVRNDGTGIGLTTDWMDTIMVSSDDILGDGDDMVLAEFAHSGALNVGESYTRTESFLLAPAFSGRYTLYVRTDSGEAVFENSLEANNAGLLDGYFDVTPIAYADLVVEEITPPTGAFSGQEADVSWRVRNQGIGLTDRPDWTDTVYLSETADGSGSLIKLGSFNHLGYLSPDGTYDRTGTVTLPDGLVGTYYFVVDVGKPYEFIYGGNNRLISGPFEIALTPPPDLVVTDIVAPDNATEGSAVDVTWTVKNQGVGEATGTWVDKVYLREFGDTGAGLLVGTYTYNGPLQAGTTYTRREQINLPTYISDKYEIIVVTDAGDTVYEHTSEDNNESVDDAQITVAVLPRPDLQVSSVTGPDVVDAGGTASVEFTVINQGPVATTIPNWTDRVYLSLDDKITSDDILVSSLSNGAALAPGEEYLSLSSTFKIPERFRGTVFVIVAADAGGSVDEWPNEQNNIALHELYVNPWPFADIVVSDVVVPAQAFEGNTISVRYTVTNLGSGPTDLDAWTEQIWLTKDKNRPHPGQGDVLLTTLSYTDGVLDVGAGYDRELTVTLPESLVSGTYYITPWVDPYAQLLEDTLAINVNPDDPNEVNNNNYKARAIDLIGTPPPPVLNADLEVTELTADPSAFAGEEISVAWTVKNTGPGTTPGQWTDVVYLSDKPGRTDAGVHLYELGRFTNLRTLASGESYSNSQTLLLNPSAKGQYIIVESFFNDDTPLNNTMTVETDVQERLPDLVVTDVTTEPEVYSGETTTISYTVENQGEFATWAGTQYWTDQIWISKDPTFIYNRAILVASVRHAPGDPLA
ncbi:APHP domain-containing protein, partial [bacterium]|nr:APHP domain-containing protein [bacterium]